MHNRKSRPGVSRAAFETYSTCNLHLLGALHAEDTDLFRGTDGLTTAGTGILAGAAGLLLSLSTLFINREPEERKGEKRRLEEEFGHAVNFPGLAKKYGRSKKNRKRHD